MLRGATLRAILRLKKMHKGTKKKYIKKERRAGAILREKDKRKAAFEKSPKKGTPSAKLKFFTQDKALDKANRYDFKRYGYDEAKRMAKGRRK